MTVLLSQSARTACPCFDVGPVPDQRLLEVGYGFGEVIVAPAPLVDHLTTHPEASGDLGGTHKIAWTDPLAHHAGR